MTVGCSGRRVGYARCSTDEQDVTVHTEHLLELGVPADRGFSR
ncbi:hypothetical protein [Nonomuraea sp. WAC 01424]|nr:hypothetical protein [Nonomuraea sp. WAC 01424]